MKVGGIMMYKDPEIYQALLKKYKKLGLK